MFDEKENPVLASATLPAAVTRYYSEEEVQQLLELARVAQQAKNQNVTNMLVGLALANDGVLFVPLAYLLNLDGLTLQAKSVADDERQGVEITVRRDVPAITGITTPAGST